MSSFRRLLKPLIKSGTSYITNGLICWWRFNGDALDYSGNGNDGTLINSPSYTTGNVWPLALDFTTEGTYKGGVTAASDFIGTSAITITAWIQLVLSFNAAAQVIITNGKTLIEGNSGNRIRFSSNGSTQVNTNANPLTTGQWGFITVTRDSSGVTNIYMNAVLSCVSNSSSGTPTAGTINVKAVGGSNINSSAPAIIDDLRVYNRVLSTSEISQIYNLQG